MTLDPLPNIYKRLEALEKRVKQLESSEIGDKTLFGVKRFDPPSISEVRSYCKERANSVDPAQFIDFYEAKGWMIGKNKMKDWQSALRTWEKRTDTNKMPSQINKIEETKDYINRVEENSNKGVPMPESLRKRINKIGGE